MNNTVSLNPIEAKVQSAVLWTLQRRTWFFWGSMVALVFGLVVLAFKGLNYGQDFTGGYGLQLKFENAELVLSDIQTALDKTPYHSAIIQKVGVNGTFSLRLPADVEVKADELLASLSSLGPSKVLSENVIGASVGSDLKLYGVLAVLASVLLIATYLSLRFQWRFALGAMLAILHDTALLIGVWALFGLEFRLETLAAVLAVAGYSVNDTIVVFDRIREEFRLQASASAEEIFQYSVIKTLGRTFVTTGTTLLVTTTILMFGGETLFGFALALTIGIVAGTYSTTYVAIHLLGMLKVSRENLVPDPKQRAKLDQAP